MNDLRRDSDTFQVPDEVEIPQTFPYGLLHPSDYPEGGKVTRFPRIREVACDPQLESALPVSGRISLLESRRLELCPQHVDLGALLAAIELGLELAPIRERQRRRIDQRQPM